MNSVGFPVIAGLSAADATIHDPQNHGKSSVLVVAGELLGESHSGMWCGKLVGSYKLVVLSIYRKYTLLKLFTTTTTTTTFGVALDS